MVLCGALQESFPCDNYFLIRELHRGCRQNELLSDIVEYQLVLTGAAAIDYY